MACFLIRKIAIAKRNWSVHFEPLPPMVYRVKPEQHQKRESRYTRVNSHIWVSCGPWWAHNPSKDRTGPYEGTLPYIGKSVLHSRWSLFRRSTGNDELATITVFFFHAPLHPLSSFLIEGVFLWKKHIKQKLIRAPRNRRLLARFYFAGGAVFQSVWHCRWWVSAPGFHMLLYIFLPSSAQSQAPAGQR